MQHLVWLLVVKIKRFIASIFMTNILLKHLYYVWLRALNLLLSTNKDHILANNLNKLDVD